MTANALTPIEADDLVKAKPLQDNFEYLDGKINSTATNLTTYLDGQLASYIGNIINTIYPIGSIYIGTTENCPLASIVGTWTKVSEGRVLQGSDSSHAANTTIAAGLPNITGELQSSYTDSDGQNIGYFVTSGTKGAFGNKNTGARAQFPSTGAGYWNRTKNVDFSASRSNSIYGKSSTVQPPAYIVNIWRRTA